MRYTTLLLILPPLFSLALAGGCAHSESATAPFQRQVFIGSDRQRMPDGKSPGHQRGKGLTFGQCAVNITPKKGAQAAAIAQECPSTTDATFSVEKSSLHYFSSDKDQYEKFSQAFQQSISRSESKDIFLFIHGYNVRFDDAVITTAQLACDLNFKGTVVCFDWPAWGELGSYLYDEENSQWAIAHLVDFLNKLKTEAGTQRIHVMTHSMGSRVFLNALHEMQLKGEFNDPGRTGRNGRFFAEVIFAAPDMDRDMFTERLVSVSNIADHFTIYGSCNDRALETSGIIHLLPRAGQGGRALPINSRLTPNMYVIDASWVDTSFLGHFCYRTPTVTRDIRELIARTAPASAPIAATTRPDDPADPAKRSNLKARHRVPLEGGEPLTYWQFDNAKPQAFGRLFTSCDGR